MTGRNISRLNTSWQVPKEMPVWEETPSVKVEQGSVPNPTVLNTATQIPITIKLTVRTAALRPMRGRVKFAAMASMLNASLFGEK